MSCKITNYVCNTTNTTASSSISITYTPSSSAIVSSIIVGASGSIGTILTSSPYYYGPLTMTSTSAYYNANKNTASLFYKQKLIPGKLYSSDESYATSCCLFVDNTSKTTINLLNIENILHNEPILYMKEALDEYHEKYYVFSSKKSKFLAFKKIKSNGYCYAVCLKHIK